MAGPRQVGRVDACPDCRSFAVPVDFNHVGTLGFVAARARICKCIVDPARIHNGEDSMQLEEVISSVAVNRRSPDAALPRWIRRKNIRQRILSGRSDTIYKHVDRCMSPAFVFIECPTRFFSTMLLQVFCSAPDKRLDVGPSGNGLCRDFVLRAADTALCRHIGMGEREIPRKRANSYERPD